MNKISELHKSKQVIEERKSQIKDNGFWDCDKCGTRYYAGINCDPCMAEEFQKELKDLRRS
jgi:ribosomal protein L37AE/L43A